MPYKTKITPDRKAVVWDYNTVFGASDEFRCYRLSDQHIQALMSTLTAMQWRTRWTDAPEDMREILHFVGQLTYFLLTPTDCEPSPVPSAGGENGGDLGAAFDQLFELLEELDVKYRVNGQLYEPVIDLVPCGCGDGDGDGEGATSAPAPVPGSSGGGNYGQFATLCDALGVLPAYLTTEMDSFLDRVKDGSLGGALLAPSLAPLAAAVGLSAGEIEDKLNDPSFIVLLEQIIIRSFNDPWTDITRQDFRNFAYRFPLVFDGAPMWAGFTLWAEFVNISELNQVVQAAAGTGNAAVCEAKFAQVGRTPYASTPVTPPNTYNFTAASGQQYIIEVFEIAASLPTITTPGTLPDIIADGKRFVGSAAQLSNVGNVSDQNFRSIDILVDGSNRINLYTAPQNAGVYAGDGYDNGLLTPTDIANIQAILQSAGMVASSNTDNVAAKDFTAVTGENYPIEYQSFRSTTTTPQPVVDFIALIYNV